MPSSSPFPLSDATDNTHPPQHSHSTMHPLQEPSPDNNVPPSSDNKGSVNNVDSQATLQYFRDEPPQSEEERHPEMPNADFLSSFLDLVELEQIPAVVPNKVFKGDPSDPSRTLGETLKGLLESNFVPIPQLESNLVPIPQLESNLVPIPQLEPRSDPVTVTSTLWATLIAIVTFILRKKMMFFAAFGVVVATILGITLGTSSPRQGKSAEDRQDTLEVMLSQEGLAGFIFNIQALWARLLELLSIPTEVLLAGDQVDDVAQDRSDLNVSASTPNLNFPPSTNVGSNPNTSRTEAIEAPSTTPLGVLTTAVPPVLSTAEAPVSLSWSEPVDSEVAEAVNPPAEEAAEEVRRTSGEIERAEAVEAVQHAAVEVAEAVQLTAEEAADAVQRKSEVAAEAVKRKAEEVTEAVKHAAEEVAEEVQRAGDEVKRTAEAAEAAQHAAEEVSEAVQR